MDYLDPRKQFRHRIVMLIGYVLIAIAIGIATEVLLYQAYGYGLNKDGKVILNGLVFISSQPHPAQISLNGNPVPHSTNARLVLPAADYQLKLERSGYNVWQRKLDVLGGTVEHFDYPFLFPVTLATTPLHQYASTPGLATQSPDRRWLLIEQPGSALSFDLYDLKNPAKAPVTVSLSAGIQSKAVSGESWRLDAWADDNQHVVLEHDYDGHSEFILLDTQHPEQSLNLNTTLGSAPTALSLNNKKYDQYYLYNSSTGSLQMASLKSPTPVPFLEHVLAYQSYGNNTMLYVSDADAPAGKVLLKLAVGDQTYVLHSFPAGTNYLVDLTKYSGVLYVVAGASAQNKVYIYRDPIGQLQAQPSHAVTPIQVLHVTNPNYLSFSDNTQFIVVEGGKEFGTYDIENKLGYKYSITAPLDAPQVSASWMDGDRLTLVSGGALHVFDYDHANPETLMPASPDYLPFFAANYKFVYALTPAGTGGQFKLTQTSLLAPADR